jgi:hypothetical protein
MPKLNFHSQLEKSLFKKYLQLKQQELTVKRAFYSHHPLLAFVTCLHSDFSVNPFPVLYRPRISLRLAASGGDGTQQASPALRSFSRGQASPPCP